MVVGIYTVTGGRRAELPVCFVIGCLQLSLARAAVTSGGTSSCQCAALLHRMTSAASRCIWVTSRCGQLLCCLTLRSFCNDQDSNNVPGSAFQKPVVGPQCCLTTRPSCVQPLLSCRLHCNRHIDLSARPVMLSA